MALVQKGRLGEAIAQFQKSLEIKPDFASARTNLGATLLQKKREKPASLR
jgi:Flp pilus assembly protein TadD